MDPTNFDTTEVELRREIQTAAPRVVGEAWAPYLTWPRSTVCLEVPKCFAS